MKLSELLDAIDPSDTVRIIKGKCGNREPDLDPDVEIIFAHYKDMLQYYPAAVAMLEANPEVKRLCVFPEIRHRKWKELGLIPPYKPEISTQYEFKDMEIRRYRDIYI